MFLRFCRSPKTMEKSLEESKLVEGLHIDDDSGQIISGEGNVIDFEEVLEPLGGSRTGRSFNYIVSTARTQNIYDYTLAFLLYSDQCPTETKPFFLNIHFNPPFLFENIYCHLSSHDDDCCKYSVTLAQSLGSPVCPNKADFDAMDYSGKIYTGPRAKPRGKIVVAWLLGFVGVGICIRNKFFRS